MKHLSNQGARCSTYVDTHKTGNAEWANVSCLPVGLKREKAVHGVTNARKALSLAVLGVLRPAFSRSNAIPLISIDRL
ncbi:hypothetical protein IHQ56_02145 [Methylobacillus flagellatus]|uniref:hypothetical protein n=1 Tax=Methylobacillus flagellatus TaxID=405 RepID=UPI002853DD61|nr:hypothetical protein [Methylobacillus flagellatus]MDR5170608.1 hypothetical protein [Methylobacillus flagellatus]